MAIGLKIVSKKLFSTYLASQKKWDLTIESNAMPRGFEGSAIMAQQ
jgi:hypothetical protein